MPVDSPEPAEAPSLPAPGSGLATDAVALAERSLAESLGVSPDAISSVPPPVAFAAEGVAGLAELPPQPIYSFGAQHAFDTASEPNPTMPDPPPWPASLGGSPEPEGQPSPAGATSWDSEVDLFPEFGAQAIPAPATHRPSYPDAAPEQAPEPSATSEDSIEALLARNEELRARTLGNLETTWPGEPAPEDSVDARLADNELLIASIEALTESGSAGATSSPAPVATPQGHVPRPRVEVSERPKAPMDSSPELDEEPFGSLPDPAQRESGPPPLLLDSPDHETALKYLAIGQELAEEEFPKWGWQEPASKPELRYVRLEEEFPELAETGQNPPAAAYTKDGVRIIGLDPTHMFREPPPGTLAEQSSLPPPGSKKRETAIARLMLHEIGHDWTAGQPELAETRSSWNDVRQTLVHAIKFTEMELEQAPRDRTKWTDEDFSRERYATYLGDQLRDLDNGVLFVLRMANEGVGEWLPRSVKAAKFGLDPDTWARGAVSYSAHYDMVHSLATAWNPIGSNAVNDLLSVRPSNVDTFKAHPHQGITPLLEASFQHLPRISRQFEIDETKGVGLLSYVDRRYPGIRAKAARRHLASTIEKNSRPGRW